MSKRAVVLGGLVVSGLVVICVVLSRSDFPSDVLAQLRSADPAVRHAAVVRLGMLAHSDARREGLAGAVRDTDEKVRLMAGIIVVGDGPGEHASWLQVPPEATRPPTPNPTRSEAADLTHVDELVYLDPWFAGTLLPGAMAAANDGDARIRTLGNRALRFLAGAGGGAASGAKR
jgi:hypothetical protein